MPKGIGYPKKKTSGKVLSAVGSSLKAAALGQMSPKAKRLAERKRIDALMSKGKRAPLKQSAVVARTTKPAQPSEGFIKGVTSGRQRLIDALSPKPKKKGSRR